MKWLVRIRIECLINLRFFPQFPEMCNILLSIVFSVAGKAVAHFGLFPLSERPLLMHQGIDMAQLADFPVVLGPKGAGRSFRYSQAVVLVFLAEDCCW
jgi:hypothetical protein